MAEKIGGDWMTVDITSPDAPQAIASRLLDNGGVDIVVHNAGITRDRTLRKMSEAEWNAVMEVNLRAVIDIDTALDQSGAMRRGAREICLSSISGIAGNVGQTNYAASKAALMGYVAARARSLAESGTTVNAVAPGFIETDMTRAIPFLIRQAGRRMNALGQGGIPRDVAEAICFLALPDAAGITGQTLRVCGQALLGS
jgi:3-oxoacyl-[acyl-carrier protein] reductase